MDRTERGTVERCRPDFTGTIIAKEINPIEFTHGTPAINKTAGNGTSIKIMTVEIEWISGFGESAEGPQHLSQMTYEQWRVFQGEPMRDRGLEHFEEYGYGH